MCRTYGRRDPRPRGHLVLYTVGEIFERRWLGEWVVWGYRYTGAKKIFWNAFDVPFGGEPRHSPRIELHGKRVTLSQKRERLAGAFAFCIRVCKSFSLSSYCLCILSFPVFSLLVTGKSP